MSPENYYNEQYEKELVEKFKKQLAPILGTEEFTFVRLEHKEDYETKLRSGHFHIVVPSNVSDKVAATFALLPMPGCCGICISTGAYVCSDLRGRGLGTILNTIRIEIARYMGYTVLLCTDVESNKAQRAILAKNGWKDIYQFVNKRTKNTVNISVIDL